MSSIQSTILPNGLTILTDSVPHAESVALGIWYGVGTRHEAKAENGIAHMVEHMLFKGTENRDAKQLMAEIEAVGGQANAYTGREITCYYVHLLAEHTPLALNILADMVRRSTYPEDEIKRERGVICQEINMVADSPDDLVFDEFQECAYQGQTMGLPILGTADIIKKLSRQQMVDYVQNRYTPSNMVIAAAGRVLHEDFVDRVAALFGDLAPSTATIKAEPARYTGGESRNNKTTLEQVHFVMGFPVGPRCDALFDATKSLSTLLGGGMSSRLFQEIREKRGLVYSVYTHHMVYADTGLFTVYAGTGSDTLGELVPVVCEQLREATEHITAEEIARVKAQLRASLLMSRERMFTRADQMVKHWMSFRTPLDIDLRLRQIDSVTIHDMQRVAHDMLTATPTLAAVGNLKTLESFDSITKRLAA
jgi:predicted Zn-dependent peptidase